MEDKADNYKTADWLRKHTWNDDTSGFRPKNRMYLLLNKSFYQLKKDTQEFCKQNYDIIISNENYRELIFHGIDCILSPKQFFMIKYLLQNGFFQNENFSQIAFTKKVRVQYKISPLGKKTISKSKKYKGTYVINGKEEIEILEILKKFKRKEHYIAKHRMVEKESKIFSDDKSEVSNYKNEIKDDIKARMLELKVEIPEFDKKFDFFMEPVYLNYSSIYPNPNTTIRTFYRQKVHLPRVKKPKKSSEK